MSTARNFMKKRHDRKERRRLEVEERLEYWQGLTPAEQLVQLDRRLGEGVGAVKQRTRLNAAIEAAKAKKAAAKKAKGKGAQPKADKKS
jgi:hypothetical protein